MRNKEAFLKDFNEVAKVEVQDDEMTIEDAAHTMNQTHERVFVLSAEFSITGNEERFYFEEKERPKTDIESEMILDYFYIGRGDA